MEYTLPDLSSRAEQEIRAANLPAQSRDLVFNHHNEECHLSQTPKKPTPQTSRRETQGPSAPHRIARFGLGLT